MKCVKNIKTSEIKRVKDDVAHNLVKKENTHTYVSKSEWRDFRDSK